MKSRTYLWALAVVIVLTIALAFQSQQSVLPVPTAPSVSRSFDFNFTASIIETEFSQLGASPDFWLNSGGKFLVSNGTARTIQGDLPAGDALRSAYLHSNPLDTDGGLHPQNVFRLLTRLHGGNVEQSLSFKINRDHWNNSPNRNESNCVLLFSCYMDENNLYYAGLRVDGWAVIKKKNRTENM